MDELVAWLGQQLDTDAAENADPYAATAWHARGCESLPDVLYPDRELGACDCGAPARVLREVDAKRQVLAEHERYAAERRRMMGGWDPQSDDSPILYALAAVYSDRPGFREEWRP